MTIRDLRQTKGYGDYLTSLGWETVRAGSIQIFFRKIFFTPFHLAKILRPAPFNNARAVLKELKTRHTIVTIIEPQFTTDKYILLLRRIGFRNNNSPLLPTKTLLVDITKYQTQKLSKDTRYEIRKSQKANLAIEFIFGNIATKENIAQFVLNWERGAKRKGFFVPFRREIANLFPAFKKDCLLVFCKNPADEIVSGAIVIINKHTANYLHAFSTPKGNTMSAAYFLISKTLAHLKQLGVRWFDFEGIFDERYPKTNLAWKGFSRFKSGWGGREVEYPKSYQKLLWF